MLVVFPSGFTLNEENTELSPNLTNDMKLSITPQANNTWELDIEMKSSIIPKQPKVYQDVLILVYTVDASVPDGIYTAHLKNLMLDFTDGGIANEADIPVNITVKRTTGIKQLTTNNEQLTIYPNPTDGKITIRNEESEVRNVEIYDIVGRNVGADLRVCPEQQGEHAGSPQQIKIDISHWANGMYFLKVDGKVFKIIKKICVICVLIYS